MHLRPPYRPAGDRVYQAIKARLIAYEFPQGRRIYLEPIAESLGVSTTPVREALNRLAERDLVIKAENKGFVAMTLTETRVKGYYDLTCDLLNLELEKLPRSTAHAMRHDEAIAEILIRLNRHTITDARTLARYTGQIFNALAAIAQNLATQHAVDMANDHLYYLRTLECQYFENVQAELIGFCELYLAGQRTELLEAINAYHERRIAALPTLLGRLQC